MAPLLETLDALALGLAVRKPQDNSLASLAPKISKEQARINWHLSACEIERAVRAYNPWPIAYTHFKDHVIRVHQAQVDLREGNAPPGTILQITPSGMLVAAKKNCLKIQRIQFPASTVVSIADCLNAGRLQGMEAQVFS